MYKILCAVDWVHNPGRLVYGQGGDVSEFRRSLLYAQTKFATTFVFGPGF